MKKLIGALIALYSAFAFSATTVPVQLLNPTGSSSGQAIVSTGASSAPMWGGIGVNGIAAIAANTVLANATGSSAAPTAFAMPSCSATANVLQYTSGTGFTCLTTLLSSPTITTPTITGVTNGSAAPAGAVGQPLTVISTAISLTNSTPANVATLNLPAGDWLVGGACQYQAAATTATVSLQCGLSSTSATQPSNPLSYFSNGTFPANTLQQMAMMQQIFSFSTATNVFAVMSAGFTTSTATGLAYIWAVRIH